MLWVHQSLSRRCVASLRGTRLDDDRVWSNGCVKKDQGNCFHVNQCVLGDSAFLASAGMTPVFQTPPNGELDPQEECFNTTLAKPRLLKSRFQLLQWIRAVIRSKSHMM